MRELEAWAYQYVGNSAAESELFDIVGRMIAAAIRGRGEDKT